MQFLNEAAGAQNKIKPGKLPGTVQPLWRVSFFLLFLGFLGFIIGRPLPSSAEDTVTWRSIEPGFEFAKYELGPPAVIRPEVYLLKFSPERFAFAASAAAQNTDVRTLTRQAGGIAGINANFFDEKGNALGLLISNGQIRQKIHRGGKVLTGVFTVTSDGKPGIEHRDSVPTENVQHAIQAGPRLIENGKALKLASADDSSRRSGIAITKDKEVILYATVLRFPGASLDDIQQMLLNPSLGVTDALNLDGGGSSQLFIESFASLQGETFITGGDAVPVGLVVKRK